MPLKIVLFSQDGDLDASITPREILVPGSTLHRRGEAAPTRAVAPWENLEVFPKMHDPLWCPAFRWSCAAPAVAFDRKRRPPVKCIPATKRRRPEETAPNHASRHQTRMGTEVPPTWG